MCKQNDISYRAVIHAVFLIGAVCFCAITGIFWVDMQSALADVDDKTGKSIKSIKHSAHGTEPDEAEVISQRILQQREPVRVQEVQPIEERTPANVKSTQTEETKRITVPKQIEMNRQEQLRNELKNLELESSRVRKNTRQLEQQIIEKQESLKKVTQPSARQRLQREIGEMQQMLDRYQGQIKNLENQQQILRKTTTAPQGFADDAEHMSDSQYGQGGRGESGGRRKDHCFIATAAYGSSLTKEVQVLRQFRDRYLAKTEWGRDVIKIYYEYSPPVADFVARHAIVRALTQAMLWPLVVLIQYPVLTVLGLMLFLALAAVILFRYKKAAC